jgi:hypothetical protein
VTPEPKTTNGTNAAPRIVATLGNSIIFPPERAAAARHHARSSLQFCRSEGA